ncbi:MAG: hypothetical protein J0H80_20435 [Rhizobiales bacterium]|nr:hypothetical protein [Hyphomicrobiales bacterium]
MRHDLSPAMLKSFLQLRADYLAMAGAYAKPSASGVRAAKEQLRQLAGVSREEFRLAWTGQLTAPEPRTRIWSALGISPSALGLMLTEGGQADLRGESEVPG